MRIENYVELRVKNYELISTPTFPRAESPTLDSLVREGKAIECAWGMNEQIVINEKSLNRSSGLVRMTGLEPTRLTTLDPKSSAATNYATSAFLLVCDAKVLLFLESANDLPAFF